MRVGRSLLMLLGAVGAVAVGAGCGSDSSGETSTAATPTEVSIQSPTSPIPTTTAAPTTTADGGGKKKPAQTTTTTGGSAPCTVPDAFQDFKFAGIDCSAAVTVAQAWDQNGKSCNTIDNPNSPDGYKRTCS